MQSSDSELFVALVAAVGTDLEMLTTEFETELTAYGYTTYQLRLSDFLAELQGHDFTGLPFDERLWAAMDAGNQLRRDWGRGDALALAAISDIVATRRETAPSAEEDGEDTQPVNLDRAAFVIRSLKTPDELRTLRAVYGPRVFVVAAYSPEGDRLSHLADEIRASRKNEDRSTWEHLPEQLIRRDMDEEEDVGQDVSDTFHRADFFIRGSNRELARADIARTLEIIFGHPFHTPTRAEHAQFLAAGEARRSAELGRQVGAAIVRPDGAVIALGANEVPIAGGGSFWEGDTRHDNREFASQPIESNKRHQHDLAETLSKELLPAITEVFESRSLPGDLAAAIAADLGTELPARLLDAGLEDITEFGRAVHAEMDALLDAARRGVAVQGCAAHTTTFPCHNCARHLIAAGIERVVFVEPYEKSKAPELHEDSIALSPSDHVQGKVTFEPFVGVAPRRYLEAFDATARELLAGQPRKTPDGTVCEFDKSTAVPLFADLVIPEGLRPLLPAYRQRELMALRHFDELRSAS